MTEKEYRPKNKTVVVTRPKPKDEKDAPTDVVERLKKYVQGTDKETPNEV